MPIYEYKCRSGHIVSELRKYEKRAASMRCPKCNQEATIAVSAPARTAWSWGDTKWDGFHDRALGKTWVDKKHREQEMHKRGLREVDDGEVEAEIRRVTSEHEQHEKQAATYHRVLTETGSAAIAAERTFNDEEV